MKLLIFSTLFVFSTRISGALAIDIHNRNEDCATVLDHISGLRDMLQQLLIEKASQVDVGSATEREYYRQVWWLLNQLEIPVALFTSSYATTPLNVRSEITNMVLSIANGANELVKINGKRHTNTALLAGLLEQTVKDTRGVCGAPNTSPGTDTLQKIHGVCLRSIRSLVLARLCAEDAFKPIQSSNASNLLTNIGIALDKITLNPNRYGGKFRQEREAIWADSQRLAQTVARLAGKTYVSVDAIKADHIAASNAAAIYLKDRARFFFEQCLTI